MYSFHSRTTSRRAVRVALLLLVAIGACGGSAESKSTPTTPTPPAPKATRIVVVTSPATTGTPRFDAGDFVVRAEDAAGAPVSGVRVTFKALSGPSGFTFVPSDTVTTDATGVARVRVLYRLYAGTDQLMATADGVTDPALVNVTIKPGPPFSVLITPSSMLLFGAGDSASFQVQVFDAALNILTDVVPDLQVTDSTLVRVTPPATIGAKAMVRALKGGGTTVISASAGGKQSFGVGVSVLRNARNVCAGVATPMVLPYGVPVAVTDSVVCIPAFAEDPSSYALIVYNQSTDGATSVGTTVTGTNVALDPLNPARIGTRPLFSRTPTLRRRSNAPKPNLRFHDRLLSQSHSLRRLFGPARAARLFARPGSMGRIRGPSYSLSGSAPSVPAVDSLVTLNVSTDACTTADMRTFRVEAVGSQAIVLADTANPTGGFTRADYQRFASRFDTLVYPLDVGNYDVPSDIDGNGHVAILFTRAVNELTPAKADAFVGGFFYARDLFPRTQSQTLDVCATSNEGEMFYMMVPDPGGTVNGNQFDLGFVDTLTTGILAHEFQHLINAGRRMYVNTSATDFEETWLDEGLSHTAEELLFFHESGYSPRSLLSGQSILDSWPHFAAWVSDDASNFVNFYLYLSDPANHSPLDTNDGIETRGAAWAFLRFAADKSFTSDVGLWRRFANSTTTGIGTLTFALQRDPRPLLEDFALSNMGNVHPSWNFGDVYTQVFVGAAFNPIPFGSLQEGKAVPVAARGGSASYYRFSMMPDVQALLRFGTSGAPPNSNLQFLLMRTAF